MGEAHNATDRIECMEKCATDENCKSATFNGPTSVNSNTCVLAYGDPADEFNLKNDSGLATAPRCCHCPCDSKVSNLRDQCIRLYHWGTTSNNPRFWQICDKYIFN